jgi:hypothetical protein
VNSTQSPLGPDTLRFATKVLVLSTLFLLSCSDYENERKFARGIPLSRSFSSALSSQYIAIPNEIRYNTLRQYTICAWVKPATVPDNNTQVAVIGIKDPRGTYNPTLELYENGIDPTAQTQFGWGGVANDASVWTRGSVKGTVPANVWTHVAVAVDWDVALASFPRMYANGAEVTYDESNNQVPTSTTPQGDSGGGWFIGGDTFSGPEGSFGIIGLISDFRIYDRALTPDEIASVFAGNDPAPVNLIGRWRLCGSSPELDSSGNGADAAVNAGGSEDYPPTAPCSVIAASSRSSVQGCI